MNSKFRDRLGYSYILGKHSVYMVYKAMTMNRPLQTNRRGSKTEFWRFNVWKSRGGGRGRKRYQQRVVSETRERPVECGILEAK